MQQPISFSSLSTLGSEHNELAEVSVWLSVIKPRLALCLAEIAPQRSASAVKNSYLLLSIVTVKEIRLLA